MVVSVLILDDDRDTLECLSDAITHLGARPCAFRSVAELMTCRDEALSCRLAILDVSLGGRVPSGIDACHWLREQGFAGPIIFLTGHAMEHPLVRVACETPESQVLSKPVALRTLAELLTAAMA
jgi:FixJ family two-component response regulator